MTGIGRLAATATSVVVAGGLALTACSGATPHRASYSFDPDDSPVQVDSPELRALKQSAAIQACPVTKVSARVVSGGLPDITLPCLGGGRDVDLAGLRGPLVLNFWSQTCGPCREESPLLQQLSTAGKGKVNVIGVDFYDPRPSYAIAFAEELGLTYPQLADPVAATKAPLHIPGLPITLLVDASGRVAYTQVGAVSSQTELLALVHDHLGVTVTLPGAGS